MHTSILLLSALGASVLGAPTYPTLNKDAVTPGGADSVAEYFNLLATKVAQSKNMAAIPVCDLSKASMPVAPTPLPPPSAGLILKHVALGRGTQNYTCDTKNATAIPVAVGAVATLFNASCVASSYPDLLDKLPQVSMQFNLSQTEAIRTMYPGNLAVSGVHYFTNATTPFFDLDKNYVPLGTIPCAKNASTPAPADAPKGQKGEAAVPWLRLLQRTGATGGLQEVFRVETAGGSAPATCKGMPASFEVQYSAQYWFWESNPKK